jgi:hypothetical protein
VVLVELTSTCMLTGNRGARALQAVLRLHGDRNNLTMKSSRYPCVNQNM